MKTLIFICCAIYLLIALMPTLVAVQSKQSLSDSLKSWCVYILAFLVEAFIFGLGIYSNNTLLMLLSILLFFGGFIGIFILISKFWLNYVMDEDGFIYLYLESLSDSIGAIKCFNKYGIGNCDAKTKELKSYVRSCEKTDSKGYNPKIGKYTTTWFRWKELYNKVNSTLNLSKREIYMVKKTQLSGLEGLFQIGYADYGKDCIVQADECFKTYFHYINSYPYIRDFIKELKSLLNEDEKRKMTEIENNINTQYYKWHDTAQKIYREQQKSMYRTSSSNKTNNSENIKQPRDTSTVKTVETHVETEPKYTTFRHVRTEIHMTQSPVYKYLGLDVVDVSGTADFIFKNEKGKEEKKDGTFSLSWQPYPVNRTRIIDAVEYQYNYLLGPYKKKI